MTKRTWMIALAAVLLLGGCAAPKDTPELRLARATELTKLEVEGGAFDNALNRGANIALAASIKTLEEELGRPATDAERDRLHGILREALGEFLTPDTWINVASKVYANNLTVAELDDLTAFYKTSAGRKLMGLQTNLAAEMGQETEALFAVHRDDFVKRVDEAVVKAFPDVARERVQR
jgi:hypothetical protein